MILSHIQAILCSSPWIIIWRSTVLKGTGSCDDPRHRVYLEERKAALMATLRAYGTKRQIAAAVSLWMVRQDIVIVAQIMPLLVNQLKITYSSTP